MRPVLIASLALAVACESGPQPVRASPEGPGPERVLRAVTFNLYNRPWKREARLRAQVETLAPLSPDLVALQEVARGPLLAGDPAERLAHGLGLGGVRAWHEQNLGVFRTGLALLSRWPLRDVAYREFARSPFWDAKGFLTATLRMGGAEIAVVDVHLASTGDAEIHRSELDELAAHVAGLSRRLPVLLLGDFNLRQGDADLDRFVRRLGADAAGVTGPTWNESYLDDCDAPGGEQIDHVLSIPGPSMKLEFRSARIVVPRTDPHPSDHCPVVADLALVPSPPRFPTIDALLHFSLGLPFWP